MSAVDRIVEHAVIAKSLFVRDLETSMVKATKRNSLAPKWKHISHILAASWRTDIQPVELATVLNLRLRDNGWSVVFKALIVAHLLLSQGGSESIYAFLAGHAHIFNFETYSDAGGSRPEQSKNIRTYAQYITEKLVVYTARKRDFCRPSFATRGTFEIPEPSFDMPEPVARAVPVDLNYLTDLGAVLTLLGVLLRTCFDPHDIDNAVTLMAFKLILNDLKKLYQYANEAMINCLSSFEKLPADTSFSIISLFKTFRGLWPMLQRVMSNVNSLSASCKCRLPEFKPIPDITAQLQQSLSDRGFTTGAPVNHALYSSAMTQNAQKTTEMPLLDLFDTVSDTALSPPTQFNQQTSLATTPKSYSPATQPINPFYYDQQLYLPAVNNPTSQSVPPNQIEYAQQNKQFAQHPQQTQFTQQPQTQPSEHVWPRQPFADYDPFKDTVQSEMQRMSLQPTNPFGDWKTRKNSNPFV